jgi:hypothetical protein
MDDMDDKKKLIYVNMITKEKRYEEPTKPAPLHHCVRNDQLEVYWQLMDAAPDGYKNKGWNELALPGEEGFIDNTMHLSTPQS